MVRKWNLKFDLFASPKNLQNQDFKLAVIEKL